VYWQGNVNIDYPVDIAASTSARIVADMSFVFKGWMFQSTPELVSNIHEIKTEFTGVIDRDYILPEYGEWTNDDAYANTLPSNVKQYDKPIITNVTPTVLRQNFDPTVATFIGYNFKDVTGVYLSGSPVAEMSEPFSFFPNASAEYPPFVAYSLPLSCWNVKQNLTEIDVFVPSIPHTGVMDVIIKGPAGYGKITDLLLQDSPPDYAQGILVKHHIKKPAQSFITLEDISSFLLQEDGNKLILNVRD
jgi:hypothetical protein